MHEPAEKNLDELRRRLATFERAHEEARYIPDIKRRANALATNRYYIRRLTAAIAEIEQRNGRLN